MKEEQDEKDVGSMTVEEREERQVHLKGGGDRKKAVETPVVTGQGSRVEVSPPEAESDEPEAKESKLSGDEAEAKEFEDALNGGEEVDAAKPKLKKKKH